ncbi:hypothetical protein [Aequorivita antarctica]|uniref:DUF4595 domain-containing protein n=1 Tax=Aequorivita antarctica TaxID=153266 RepID=A0A5C6YXG9_9FLAO|nr:hypothetical protein [Aequorivita antarctica]TXD71791.1 hypothetical protein ESU54_15325 [Aequorivita antarctica]SRX75509.1 hypothetical protein AEQU3_02505 [Aequorivita antarctica]
MKRIFFLFTASLFFLACSNDDNGSGALQELKIKKYTSISFDANGNQDGHLIEYYFDENGKKTKDHIIDIFGDYEWNSSYNTLGQVAKKSRKYLNYPVDIVEKYIYNEENKLSYLFMDQDSNGVYEDSLRFTHQTNQIIAQWYSPGDVKKEFYYDAAGNLNAINYIGDLGVVSEELITYDSASNIMQINFTSGSTQHDYKYEYDENTNPFYKEFHDYYFNTVWRDGGLLSKYSLFFSPNNITKIIFTSSEPSENYIITKNTIYNNDGYPISAVVKKDDVLIEELIYEYY